MLMNATLYQRGNKQPTVIYFWLDVEKAVRLNGSYIGTVGI